MTPFIGFLLAASVSTPIVAQRVIITAIAYKVDPVVALKTILCESDLKHEGIYGDNKKAYGIAQFHKPTFDMFKKEAGAEYLNYFKENDQIELFSWAIANGKQKHWTCYTKITS